MSDSPPMIVDAVTHRKLAVALFNGAWDLMDKPSRTPAENDTLMHAAHASRWHWEQCGKAVNLARGDWQISRVYTVLGRAEPALWHARRCLEICLRDGFADWDLAYAHEAVARAARLAGDEAEYQKHLHLARAAGEKIAEADDRENFAKDLGTL